MQTSLWWENMQSEKLGYQTRTWMSKNTWSVMKYFTCSDKHLIWSEWGLREFHSKTHVSVLMVLDQKSKGTRGSLKMLKPSCKSCMPAPKLWQICPGDVDIFHRISEDVQGINIHHLEMSKTNSVAFVSNNCWIFQSKLKPKNLKEYERQDQMNSESLLWD